MVKFATDIFIAKVESFCYFTDVTILDMNWVAELLYQLISRGSGSHPNLPGKNVDLCGFCILNNKCEAAQDLGNDKFSKDEAL